LVSDSPYNSQDMVVSHRLGAVSGMAASLLMLALVFVLKPLSGISVSELLIPMGSFLPLSDQVHVVATGLAVHVFLGGVFGVLYATSQQRIPAKALIPVAGFYGFSLWLFWGVIFGWLFGTELREILHSWLWLLASLLYGIVLGRVAVWRESQRPQQSQLIVPLD